MFIPTNQIIGFRAEHPKLAIGDCFSFLLREALAGDRRMFVGSGSWPWISYS